MKEESFVRTNIKSIIAVLLIAMVVTFLFVVVFLEPFKVMDNEKRIENIHASSETMFLESFSQKEDYLHFLETLKEDGNFDIIDISVGRGPIWYVTFEKNS